MTPSPKNNGLYRGSQISPKGNHFGPPLKALSYRQNESTSDWLQKEHGASPHQTLTYTGPTDGSHWDQAIRLDRGA